MEVVALERRFYPRRLQNEHEMIVGILCRAVLRTVGGEERVKERC